MTCIILDDEELSIKHIVDYNIKKIPYLNLLGAFTNPQEALTFIQENPVDLIFLDVEMPNYDIDGIDFMRIMNRDQRYILITAHPQYALESYEFNVVDYLRKPFSFDRFVQSIQKARSLIKPREVETKSEASSKPVDSLFVRTEDKLLLRVPFDTICYLEAERNNTIIFLGDDQVFSKKALNKLESELPANLFMRISKSYVVALAKVEFVEKEQVGIMRDKGIVQLPLSNMHRKMLLQGIESSRS